MRLKSLFRNVLHRGSEVAAAAGTCVPYAGLRLPPVPLRYCTIEFKDDRFFLDSARTEARKLIRHCGLSRQSNVLDVGCGSGRLAIGILDVLGPVRAYEGIDVDRYAIDWCRNWITAEHPKFRFSHLDVHNRRYNRAGKIQLDEQFRLEWPDGHFHLIYLYSVFTHMEVGDIKVYLREFKRILSPTGMVFMTAYLEPAVPEVSVNPPGYRGASNGPLHRVRLNKDSFQRLLSKRGFRLVRLEHRGEFDEQSGVYLAHASEAGHA